TETDTHRNRHTPFLGCHLAVCAGQTCLVQVESQGPWPPTESIALTGHKKLCVDTFHSLTKDDGGILNKKGFQADTHTHTHTHAHVHVHAHAHTTIYNHSTQNRATLLQRFTHV